jgi:hypothetical protein
MQGSNYLSLEDALLLRDVVDKEIVNRVVFTPLGKHKHTRNNTNYTLAAT